MVNIKGDLPFTVVVDGRPCTTRSTYAWSAGGTVLTFSTVLPDRGLAAELVSTYTGHRCTGTIATHLLLGPVGSDSDLSTVEHPHLSPAESARECAYDHAHHLIERLRVAGREAGAELGELSFTELERVE